MSNILKNISFSLLGLMTSILIVASIIEKIHGSSYAYEHIYTSPLVIALWTLLTVTSISCLLVNKTWRHISIFCLHISFALILGGAMVTHVSGEHGRMHLRTGSEDTADSFVATNGLEYRLPFAVALKEFELKHHSGTTAPMDYISTIVIHDGEKKIEAAVSMNDIYRYRNYRFYQSGFDRDGLGSTLAVSHDPWGIGITYAGYLLLLLSMMCFFFEKGSRFRALTRHPSLRKMLIFIAFAGTFQLQAAAAPRHDTPRTIPEEAAEAFGDLYVYYNDRICPLQTFAKDFTVKLYGKSTYKGLTCVQVLAGWYFFSESWMNEPMIKIKGEDAKAVLGISGRYASLSDFMDGGIYKLETALQNMSGKDIRNIYSANEKFNLIGMVCSGSMMDIDKGIADEDTEEMIQIFRKLRKEQAAAGSAGFPSEKEFRAEKIYNSLNLNKFIAMFCLASGILAFLIFCLSERKLERFRILLSCICAVIWAYLTFHIGLRWYISGHIPLSNGYETMQFMAWCCIILCLCIHRRFRLALPLGILICGAAMLVSMMGESNPRITQLMPVLQSPLLSIHVMVIMTSYVLFAFMMLNGVAAFIISADGGNEERIVYLNTVSNIMLYPALFLLTAGIFIGAVWANLSWGRYWGWDPKEVWALITMLIYSLGIHSGSLKWFREPMNFHLFCILAFISVLFTYFGVNLLLGGLHSYA